MEINEYSLFKFNLTQDEKNEVKKLLQQGYVISKPLWLRKCSYCNKEEALPNSAACRICEDLMQDLHDFQKNVVITFLQNGYVIRKPLLLRKCSYCKKEEALPHSALCGICEDLMQGV